MREYIEKHGMDEIDPLTDFAYAVAQKYGEASGALSAEMYDAVAEIQNAKVPPAEIAPTPTLDEVSKTIRGVTKKSKNVNMVANSVGRLVKRTGADTTLMNAKRDRAQFAWVPSGDSCPFCIMLASNGWLNVSKETMRNGHAEHIHANCDCTYAVRFDDKSYVEGYDPQKYRDMYYGRTIDDDIIEAVDDKWGYGDTSTRLMAIRRQLYKENKDKINAQKRAAYKLKQLREKGSGDNVADMLKIEEITYEKNDQGRITEANGFNREKRPDEYKTAEWLIQKFGGSIECLAEIPGQENPDYEWNGKLWDLKSPENHKNLSKLIRKGLSQIYPNPGGIVLDTSRLKTDFEDIEEIVERRMRTSLKKEADVIYKYGDNVKKVIRYKR